MSVQDRINQYWTERAPAYDDYQQQPDRLAADAAVWARIWADALPPAPTDVLDVGTGSGHVALTLASLGHRVTGIDLAEGMLDRARRHADGLPNPPVFRRGDAVAPDFPDGSFAAVVNRYVMWTLREPAIAVANWIRLLRPGGTLAVVDSTWFPNGLDASGENFGRWYDTSVRDALPLAAASSIQQTADVLAEAGLRGVEIVPLTALLELDQRLGVAPNHEVQLQYLIRGRA
ncbi:class I SAM-dependent methyltransferase [Cryptosporangium aurantiacum]|uniref:Methyltransferase domain-containing protein n=1 Tax=Cryptosporangium aurantiacum TaxID=134849 RepID=A0A1M7RJY3_9ACTN|nr:class I SAM-dependent methyltransferase [Cryptosporangium aurantiacum]SHN46623.1 Methyltransferase domain-containing protein [Cryptosporangium aurantiacum]